MGKLSCSRCGASAEADSREKADELIDHARGQMIGRPCSGKQSDLTWTGGATTKRESVVVEKVTEKPKKSKRR